MTEDARFIAFNPHRASIRFYITLIAFTSFEDLNGHDNATVQ